MKKADKEQKLYNEKLKQKSLKIYIFIYFKI